ncbi:hypothetical protein CYMTET_23985 [Cymbomonas tetramitiformis]|uniref:Uncharacterized protein n=1 Tax=Cymbomonas tetramitiformis TaxID=36881 RepID=A0AAE0FXF2_9CHLO|nr:hypothetical protein CYMTET_23985 [Cymbomonas tetramitiformis]
MTEFEMEDAARGGGAAWARRGAVCDGVRWACIHRLHGMESHACHAMPFQSSSVWREIKDNCQLFDDNSDTRHAKIISKSAWNTKPETISNRIASASAYLRSRA